jgi:hypothetical protein
MGWWLRGKENVRRVCSEGDADQPLAAGVLVFPLPAWTRAMVRDHTENAVRECS